MTETAPAPSTTPIEQPDEDTDPPAAPDAQVITLESDFQYLHLPTSFTQDIAWSNDPRKLKLRSYFNPKQPHLAVTFDVDGLMPVLREDGVLYRFLLIDAKGRFYFFEEWEGFLWWVKADDLEELETVVERVDWILCELGGLDLRKVLRGRHPADHVEDGCGPE